MTVGLTEHESFAQAAMRFRSEPIRLFSKNTEIGRLRGFPAQEPPDSRLRGKDEWLPFLRRYASDLRREPRMRIRIDRPVSNRIARGVLAKKIVAFPVQGWPDWSGPKATAAIGADVTQYFIDAISTKGALVAADAHPERSRGQGLVAVFAGRSQFKHGGSFTPAASLAECCP